MNKDSSIFVAGHRGLVGSAIVRALQKEEFTNLLIRSKEDLDLRNASQVTAFFQKEKPEFVFLAAARVGGILANATKPVEFLFDNLLIQNNVIQAAYASRVSKLLFLGSSCIYPREAPQPIKEEYLLTGPLEKTNRAYAIAKIAGIELVQSYDKEYGANFISAMPTNLYGPHDTFDEKQAHVIPALISRFHKAKMEKHTSVSVWGTGTPRREFLHVDDLAQALLFLMQNYDDPSIINVGTGEDIFIRELVELIRTVVGYQGGIIWDSSKPDGTPRKLLDVSKLNSLGWRPIISFQEGLQNTYEWYLSNRV